MRLVLRHLLHHIKYFRYSPFVCSTFACLTAGFLPGLRYYEGGVSSVYFWDLDEGFAGVVLLKKSRF